MDPALLTAVSITEMPRKTWALYVLELTLKQKVASTSTPIHPHDICDALPHCGHCAVSDLNIQIAARRRGANSPFLLYTARRSPLP